MAYPCPSRHLFVGKPPMKGLKPSNTTYKVCAKCSELFPLRKDISKRSGNYLCPECTCKLRDLYK